MYSMVCLVVAVRCSFLVQRSSVTDVSGRTTRVESQVALG